MLCTYGAVDRHLLYKYPLFVAFTLFGLLEEAHQRNMRWHLPPNRGNSIIVNIIRN